MGRGMEDLARLVQRVESDQWKVMSRGQAMQAVEVTR